MSKGEKDFMVPSLAASALGMHLLSSPVKTKNLLQWT